MHSSAGQVTKYADREQRQRKSYRCVFHLPIMHGGSHERKYITTGKDRTLTGMAGGFSLATSHWLAGDCQSQVKVIITGD